MNSAPLTPEQIDLLLSADLDGEFDAAASDLGLEPAAARASLAEAGVDDRRADLAAARDLLAEPVALDELLAARLRSKAVKAGVEAADDQRHEQRSRRSRMYGIVSGVAAALIVVVALGAMLRTNSSESKSDSDTASGALSGAPTTRRTVVATDSQKSKSPQQLTLSSEYSSVDDLAKAIRSRSALAASAVNPTSVESQNFAGASQDNAGALGSAYQCESAAQKLERKVAAPLAGGTTHVADEPLSVLIYGSGDGRTAYVFDRECKLVNQQLIH